MDLQTFDVIGASVVQRGLCCTCSYLDVAIVSSLCTPTYLPTYQLARLNEENFICPAPINVLPGRYMRARVKVL